MKTMYLDLIRLLVEYTILKFYPLTYFLYQPNLFNATIVPISILFSTNYIIF